MKLLWKYVNDDYLNWLRINYESRIPKTNYNEEHYKPFFGALFSIEDLVYVTQVSSPKERHTYLPQTIDFHRLYHTFNKHLIGVVNLNFMFPVPYFLLTDVKYEDIEKYRTFKNNKEKDNYIKLLRMELNEINRLNIIKFSKKVYDIKYSKPNDKVSLRCFNFKKLEKAPLEYFRLLLLNILRNITNNQ